MNTFIVPICGMHCRSCELLIEDQLKAVPGVKRCEVSYKKQKAFVSYDVERPKMHRIETAVRAAGYSVGEPGKRPWVSRKAGDYKELGIAFLLLLGLYWLLKQAGIDSIALPSGSDSDSTSIPVVLLIGLTAGFSTCMALIGGLVLGISARHSEMHPEATPAQKFRPHLFFNLGRFCSYLLLGGVLGWVGASLSLSNVVLGLLTLVVGGVMVLLGVKLIGIFPRLENVSFTLPSRISKLLGMKRHEKEYSHKGSVILGALTFFLPCGFTQAMQLYAMSSGSFTQGAMIMGAFALGTAPGLLGIGGISSVVKGVFAQRFFKFAGLVVIGFAVFNLSNGLNLLGIQTGSGISDAKAVNQDPNVQLVNGVQVVSMRETTRGYVPNAFTIQKGLPVRWVINAEAPFSCASTLSSPALKLRTQLKEGENIIEFTPKTTGKISFSCAMGMYRGSFTVVKDGAIGSVNQKESSEGLFTPTTSAQNGNTQVITTDYTYAEDIQPNTFSVQRGKPVRFEVRAKENGYGCMSTIMIPGLFETPQLLKKGKTIVMKFIPTTPGTYDITCAMGVPRGVLQVQ